MNPVGKTKIVSFRVDEGRAENLERRGMPIGHNLNSLARFVLDILDDGYIVYCSSCSKRFVSPVWPAKACPACGETDAENRMRIIL